MRSGVIVKKLGMSQIYRDGAQIPVTVLKMDSCRVVGARAPEKDGYSAVVLGAGRRKPKNVAKPQRSVYEAKSMTPPRIVAEFRVDQEAMLEEGAEFSAAHFVVGQHVDAVGQSIGKGFAGVMKRHNFAGLRASHGVSVNHRSQGSTGQCQDPGRVFKGKKMAGHMGAARVTVQNLEICDINEEKGWVVVKGAVPGSKGGWVFLRDAVKKPLPKEAPMPAGLVGMKQEKEAAQETQEPQQDQEPQETQESEEPKEQGEKK